MRKKNIESWVLWDAKPLQAPKKVIIKQLGSGVLSGINFAFFLPFQYCNHHYWKINRTIYSINLNISSFISFYRSGYQIHTNIVCWKGSILCNMCYIHYDETWLHYFLYSYSFLKSYWITKVSTQIFLQHTYYDVMHVFLKIVPVKIDFKGRKVTKLLTSFSMRKDWFTFPFRLNFSIPLVRLFLVGNWTYVRQFSHIDRF